MYLLASLLHFVAQFGSVLWLWAVKELQFWFRAPFESDLGMYLIKLEEIATH